MDPYKILDVPRDATYEQIKKQYRKLALDYHPDRNAGDLEKEEKFKQINEAWTILSDPTKRREYDNSDFQLKFSFGFDPFRRAAPPPLPKYGEIRGKHITIPVRVSPFDMLLMTTLTLRYKRMVPCVECDAFGSNLTYCKHCEGYGLVRTVERRGHQTVAKESACQECHGRGYVHENPCKICAGFGVVSQETEERVQLCGLGSDGLKVVSGKGNYGPYKGQPGDLLIGVTIIYPDPETISSEARELLKEAAKLIHIRSKDEKENKDSSS